MRLKENPLLSSFSSQNSKIDSADFRTIWTFTTQVPPTRAPEILMQMGESPRSTITPEFHGSIQKEASAQ